MTDEQVHAFVARYMVGYELWSYGVRDASQPWAGRGLALHVNGKRKVVAVDSF
jgi:D-glycerate 3-kinase